MYLPALGFCQALVALLVGLVGDCAAPTFSPHQQRLSEVLGNTALCAPCASSAQFTGDWKSNWLQSPYSGVHAAAVRVTPDKLQTGSNCQPSTLRSYLMTSVSA